MSKRKWIAIAVAVAGLVGLAFMVLPSLGIVFAPGSQLGSPRENAREGQQQAADDATPDLDWIEPIDFASLQLGPRIAGSQGETRLTVGDTPAGTIRSHVACAAGAQSCNPSSPSAESVYTYVLEVIPGGPASSFQATEAIPGFNGVAGFHHRQAGDAVGEGSELVLQCNDGLLIWALNGGALWSEGSPITLFWQSTYPPAEAGGAYQLLVEGKLAEGTGPFPSGEAEASCG